MSGALRVLVVDDSVVHRQTISDVLRGAEGVEIVGKAANGEEALRMVSILHPDLITLDLEMPRMDGYTFLRILNARDPMPVIVISSQSQRENVFKALELGALDFVARPAPGPSEVAAFREELLAKVQVVRSLRPVKRPSARPAPAAGTAANAGATVGSDVPAISSEPPPSRLRTTTGLQPVARPARPMSPQRQPRRLVVIASSTGGPQAVMDLVGRLQGTTQNAFIIAQHMPERFTRTFAERLNRRAAIPVTEGEDGSLVEAGTVWICAGSRATEVSIDPATGIPRLVVVAPDAADKYVPSADRLFRSAAAAVGARVTAVIITGMGDDGAIGIAAVKRAGGEVWVEAQESAIVDGMPAAARRTGLADTVAPLHSLISRLVML